MKKRAEIELGYRLKNASELTKFSSRLRQAFEQAGQDAEKTSRRVGLVEKAVNKLPAHWSTAGVAAARAMEKTSRAVDRAWLRLKGGAGTVVSVFGRVTRTIFSLKAALVGLGLGLLGKSFLDVSRETENYATRLSTLLGSQQKATEAMAYFQEVAAKVPFTLQDVVESGTSLESFGASHQKWLNPLTDLAAVMGISLPEAAQALGRAYAGGAGAADIFRERGILQIIKDSAKMRAGIEDITKLTLPQFRKLMLLTFTDSDGKIAGASQKLASNWDGMISMLSDKWYQFRQKMMAAGVFDLLKTQLQRLLDALDKNGDKLTTWAQAAGKAVTKLMQKGVNFVENIIKNWEEYQKRWDKFKSGAAEYWEKSKSVAATLSSLFTTALNSWNSLPPVIREFGLIGALLGGKKAKLVFATMLGIGYLTDKLKGLTDEIKQGGGTGASILGGLETSNSVLELLTPSHLLSRMVSLFGGTAAANPTEGLSLNASGAAGNVSTGAAGAVGINLGSPTTGGKNTSWNIGQGGTDKDIAAYNAAAAKQSKDYIAMVAESVDLETALRRDGMNALERNLAQMGDRYETTYGRIEDLILAGVYTEEQADTLKAQLNQNYLTAVEKAQAEHDKCLLRSIETYGKTGRELKLTQLDQELEDLRAAGHSAILIEQYKAQRLEEINKGWLENTLDYYIETQNTMADGVKNAMQGTQSAWADYIRSGLTDFESFCDAIEETWVQMLAQLVAQWTMSGFAGLLKDLLGLFTGKGFSLGNTLKGLGLEGLFGSSTGGSVAGSIVNGIASSAAWSGIKSGAAAVAGALGLDSLATWITGTAAQAATEAAVATSAQVALTGVLGPEAAALLGPTAATEMAVTTTAQTALTGVLGPEAAAVLGPTGANAATNAASLAGLSATLTPMGIALGVGSLGQLLSSMGFLMDGPMTPQEAISNWEGTSRFVEDLTSKFDELGPTMSGINQGFGEFSETAMDFAQRFEQLGTVAGFTAEQLEAVKAKLSPAAQAYLEGGQAAKSMADSVNSLAQRMNADLNSYTMTSNAVNNYNSEIDRLASSLGLTGNKLTSFRDEIWDLANSFSQGGEEAGRYGKNLSDFIGSTLGDITEQAKSTKEALNGLWTYTEVDYGTKGRGAGSSSSSGYVGLMHSGGYVDQFLSRLPKYHDGGDVLSWLQPGEFVMQRSAVNAATLPALRTLNAGGLPAALSDGGSYRGGNVITVAVTLANVGAGVDVVAIPAAATEGAKAGALAALKTASES
ncbi:MAG: hypothetical protein K9K65_11665, partial [Desulfarculaceae bacterium]|nr:hypothetical protein [Desulfarculaceae bacterium]